MPCAAAPVTGRQRTGLGANCVKLSFRANLVCNLTNAISSDDRDYLLLYGIEAILLRSFHAIELHSCIPKMKRDRVKYTAAAIEMKWTEHTPIDLSIIL